ncbi:DUF2842 domain-containing protein [Chthonobacter rhizosphaerae]|uniref:DUF2842 domain-containing protein n=1 Tax=Chthonobacter rhizosphaerae TaxID=2735553 RepID=UPI0015EF32D4|nr:DUF2842 domain-containing protein [Chthonobacter rhizosphaerae]
MPPRLRKLIGAMLLVLLVVTYPFLVVVFAAAILPGSSGWTQLAFYAVGGLLWVPPAAFLIWLIGRRDPAPKA